MKPKPSKEVEKYRVRTGAFGSDERLGNNGLFIIPSPFASEDLRVIASDGGHWDHVSVSLRNRCPTWEEMCFVKDLFWNEDETVMQLHPPKKDYVNNHPYCLHMWKPRSKFKKIPRPPKWMVGIKD